MEQRFQ